MVTSSIGTVTCMLLYEYSMCDAAEPGDELLTLAGVACSWCVLLRGLHRHHHLEVSQLCCSCHQLGCTAAAAHDMLCGVHCYVVQLVPATLTAATAAGTLTMRTMTSARPEIVEFVAMNSSSGQCQRSGCMLNLCCNGHAAFAFLYSCSQPAEPGHLLYHPVNLCSPEPLLYKGLVHLTCTCREGPPVFKQAGTSQTGLRPLSRVQVGNYDYMYDIRLQLDGEINVRVFMAGGLLAARSTWPGSSL